MTHIIINYNNEIMLPICLNADRSDDVIDMKIDKGGNLILILSDERTYNCGQLIGKDGMVYTPHIEKNANNRFTFTI